MVWNIFSKITKKGQDIFRLSNTRLVSKFKKSEHKWVISKMLITHLYLSTTKFEHLYPIGSPSHPP